jgi:hypothetical protein
VNVVIDTDHEVVDMNCERVNWQYVLICQDSLPFSRFVDEEFHSLVFVQLATFVRIVCNIQFSVNNCIFGMLASYQL